MFGMGTGELLIILVIVLVVFGGKRLPELASGLGASVKNFRRAMRESDDLPAREPPREVGPTVREVGGGQIAAGREAAVSDDRKPG